MSYKAFLSYSHSEDAQLAPVLQDALHHFAKPWYRLRKIQVFRDKTSLSATPALWPSIEQALSQSEYFLLLASPGSAGSHWVEREVGWWLEHRPVDHILVLLTSGDLKWDATARDFDWSQTTALPSNLRGRLADEPLYVDLRWARNENDLSLRHLKFRSAVLDIAAPLNGVPKDDLDGEDVRQHRKTRRIMAATIAVLVCLTLAAGIGAWLAYRESQVAKEQRNNAEAQRNEAVTQRKNAEAATVEANRQKVAAQTAQALAEERQVEAQRQTRIAVAQRNEAQHQSRVALSEQIAVQARLAMKTSPVQALLLAAEATQVSLRSGDQRTAASEEVLREALGQTSGRGLGGHTGIINAFAISADDRWIATISSDSTARLWDLKASDPGAVPLVLRGHQGSIRALAISPDSHWLATGGDDRSVHLWNLKSSQPGATPIVFNVPAGESPNAFRWEAKVTAVAFSPDNRWLAAASEDTITRLWDLAAADPAASYKLLKGHTYGVERVAFSPDSRFVATASRDNFALLWRLEGQGPSDPPIVLRGSDEVIAMAFSPNSRWLVTGSCLWDLQAPAINKPLVLKQHKGAPWVAAFSPDSWWLVTGGDSGVALLWDLKLVGPSLTPIELVSKETKPLVSNINRVAFSYDSRLLVTAGSYTGARLWNLQSKDIAASAVLLRQEDDYVTALAFSPAFTNKNKLVVSFLDAICVWDIDFWGAGKSFLTLHGQFGAASRLAISHDSHWLASISVSDYSAHLWDLNSSSAASHQVISLGHAAAESVDFTRDNRWLISRIREGGITVTGLKPSFQTGDSVRAPSESSLLSADSRWLITTGPDNNASLWSLSRGHFDEPSFVLRGHQAAITASAVSPDSRRLATGSKDGSLIIWRLDAPDPSRDPITLKAHRAAIRVAAFSPDNRWLATGSDDHSVRLWDVSAPANPVVLTGHDAPVTTLIFAPNSKLLFSGSNTGSATTPTNSAAYLWDLAARDLSKTGVLLQHYQGASIEAAAISRDGRWLVTAIQYGQLGLWDLHAKHPEHSRKLLRSERIFSFSPDSRWLASTTGGAEVHLWRLDVPDPSASPLLLSARATDTAQVVFSSDSSRLATLGANGSTYLFDLKSASPANDLVEFVGHNGWVPAAAFSSDGRWFATGGVDGTTRLWNLRPEELVMAACRVAGRNLTATEWNLFFPGKPHSIACPEYPVIGAK